MPAINGVIYALNFSTWKRRCMRLLFQDQEVRFIADTSKIASGDTLAIWGMRDPDSRLPENVNVVRIEDGFLRSVGLGADLIRPLSWVWDDLGIYFNATRPSRLEVILASTQFDQAILNRARALRNSLVAARLTKYNVGSAVWTRPGNARRIVLVPGQVESDASITYGAPSGLCSVRRNIDLLKAVQQANPDAWVVYKPHPDVLAGLRAQGADEASALQWCDEQVVDVSMSSMLDMVDEVHVITSLAGFEALLRGKRVVCHGQPFYAGWGLTDDMAPLPRRTRRLTLDELVAGALILYPNYFNRRGDALITPEAALEELIAWRDSRPGGITPWWRKLFRVLLRRVVGVR